MCVVGFALRLFSPKSREPGCTTDTIRVGGNLYPSTAVVLFALGEKARRGRLQELHVGWGKEGQGVTPASVGFGVFALARETSGSSPWVY